MIARGLGTRFLDLRRGQTTALLVARIIEQASLGLASLLLASRVGVEAYASLSALFIVNSLAVTLSDFGQGMHILSVAVGETSMKAIWIVRLVNVGVAVACLTAGAAIGGTSGGVVAAGGLVWLLSAEAYIRKAALIRMSQARRTARNEILGASAFSVFVLVALVRPSQALPWLVVALAAKHTAEVLASTRWHEVVGRGPAEILTPLNIWLSQALSFASANADFVIVGVVLGPTAFSLYSLGFRIASLIPSQVSSAVQRVMLVEYGQSGSSESLRLIYRRRSKQLFGIGAGAAVATMVVAPLVALVLGSSWSGLAPILVVLALAVPFRMVASVGGLLLIGAKRTRLLVQIEVVRLVVISLALVAAAFVSFTAFIGVSVAVASFTALVMHIAAARVMASAIPRWLGGCSLVMVPVALAAAAVLGPF